MRPADQRRWWGGPWLPSDATSSAQRNGGVLTCLLADGGGVVSAAPWWPALVAQTLAGVCL